MNREERIAWAKQEALKSSPERARQREVEQSERSARIAAMGAGAANREAYRLSQDSSIPWMGPVATPDVWSTAVAAARAVAIEAARHRRTITYGELRIAAFEATGMKVGHNQFAELAMSLNVKSDGCLLSAIIVRADTRGPGDGFVPYARSQGFDQPLASLQRQVFGHFSADG